MTTMELFELRQSTVDVRTRKMVEFSFDIAGRIQDIMSEKRMKQKDLAHLLNKKEAEISRWMKGTHNFTIETIMSIENALDATIIEISGSHKQRGK